MSRGEIPLLVILICSIGFMLLAFFYPRVSATLGAERPTTDRRLLAAILGMALFALWMMGNTLAEFG